MEFRKTFIAISSVALLSAGVVLGWAVWGRSLGTANERIAELERTAERLEADLGNAQAEIARARELNHQLAERQRTAEAVIDRAAGRLAAAGRNAKSITELVERSITIVDELFAQLGGGGEEGMGGRSP